MKTASNFFFKQYFSFQKFKSSPSVQGPTEYKICLTVSLHTVSQTEVLKQRANKVKSNPVGVVTLFSD